MNPTTLTTIIQQIIQLQEDRDRMVAEVARLNQLLSPKPEPETSTDVVETTEEGR